MSTELAVKELLGHVGALAEKKAEANDQIDLATHWAKKLMDVVQRCNLSKDIQGKKYLEVEGWQLIGEFAHVTPILDWTRPWLDESGVIKGYEAKVNLVDRDDRTVAAGESSCGFDAFPCQGKKGSEVDKAARSAAQTWATSKAFRNKFSFVAKIAGFEPTPAEEMATTFSDYPILNQCSIHDEPWREGKYGKFHGLKGGGFCNIGNVLTAEFKKVANSAGMDAKVAGEWLKKNEYPTWSTMSNDQKAEAIMAVSAGKENDAGAEG